MILFLYGENDFESSEKLRSIKEKYVDASLGDTNLFSIDLADKKMDFKEFSRIVTAQPFLAKKRLIIIKNLLYKGSKKLQTDIIDFLPKIPETSVIIFYEVKTPDKRSKLFKTLNKPKISQEFKLLNPIELKKWIEKRIDKKLIKNKPDIDYEFIESLLLKSGNNLWQISAQVEKINLYLGAHVNYYSKDDIKKLTNEKTLTGIFEFIDILAKKDIKNAYIMLHNLLDQGENEFYILTMIAYQFRNMLIIKDLTKDTNSNEYQLAGIISKKAKINPYVVGKMIKICNKFLYFDLKKIYQQLLKIDIDIKTGKVSPILALDMLVEKVCK